MIYDDKVIALVQKYTLNDALMLPFPFGEVVNVKASSIEVSGLLR